jgi:hypothetical protein
MARYLPTVPYLPGSPFGGKATTADQTIGDIVGGVARPDGEVPEL